MGRQAREVKIRVCDHCQTEIRTDAKGLMEHSLMVHGSAEKVHRGSSIQAQRHAMRGLFGSGNPFLDMMAVGYKAYGGKK